jgi:hypothetical protein
MRLLFKQLFVSLLAFTSLSISAATTYQTGKIIDHAAIVGGLLIRFDSTITLPPDNCKASPYGWMFVTETNKALLSVTLLAIASGNRTMVIYTNGFGTNGYCQVTQVDPTN